VPIPYFGWDMDYCDRFPVICSLVQWKFWNMLPRRSQFPLCNYFLLITIGVFSHHGPCALAAGTNHTANVGTFNLITESNNYKMDSQETQQYFRHISFTCSRPTVSFGDKQLCFQLLPDCTKLRSKLFF